MLVPASPPSASQSPDIELSPRSAGSELDTSSRGGPVTYAVPFADGVPCPFHALSPCFPSVQPRKIFVQPNTFVENDEVVLKEYPLNAAGAIESFIERRL